MDVLITIIAWLGPVVLWAVKLLILYFVLKKAFYQALVKFHETHGFYPPYEEPEEPYEPAPEETISELPGQSQ